MPAHANDRRAAVYGLLLALLPLMLAGCSGTTSAQSQSGDAGQAAADTYDATALLKNTAYNVIIPIYSDLAQKARDLEASVARVVEQPNAANVRAARAAWRAMRVPWERSEAFLYGPVAGEGYDPRLDSWPLDRRGLEVVLQRNERIDQALIDSLDNNLRGFHAVEFLLWSDSQADEQSSPRGRDAAREVARALQQNPSRRAYLVETATDLRQTAAALLRSWKPGGGDFAHTLASAGTGGNTVYVSRRAAMREIIQGMATIAGEVADVKLAAPLEKGNPKLVESRYSFNSRNDFMNNIRGIKAVYLGEYPLGDTGSGNGIGVSDYVRAMGREALDAAIRSQLDIAIARIEAIDQPFHHAITGSAQQRKEIREAIEAVRTLQHLFRDEVLALLDHTDFTP